MDAVEKTHFALKDTGTRFDWVKYACWQWVSEFSNHVSNLHIKHFICAATSPPVPTVRLAGGSLGNAQTSTITVLKRIAYISVYLARSEQDVGVTVEQKQNGIDNQRHIVLNLRARLFPTTVNPQNSNRKKQKKKHIKYKVICLLMLADSCAFANLLWAFRGSIQAGCHANQ